MSYEDLIARLQMTPLDKADEEIILTVLRRNDGWTELQNEAISALSRLRAEVEKEWNETLVKVRETLTQEISKEWAALEARAQAAEAERDALGDSLRREAHYKAIAEQQAAAAEAALAELREAAIGVVDAWPSADGLISEAIKNLRALVKGGE